MTDERLDIPALLKMDLKELIEIEISLATGTPKPLNRSPAVATVITAANLELVKEAWTLRLWGMVQDDHGPGGNNTQILDNIASPPRIPTAWLVRWTDGLFGEPIVDGLALARKG